MDKKFMLIAIEEAKKSKDSDGYWVGAVIIKDEKIISKAHGDEKKNKGHAEELAIKDCKENLKDALIYVTMEPCDFRNSRKSCCDLIIESGIKKVIYGVLDPREECHGIKKLRNACVEVEHFKEFEESCKMITPNLNWN